MSLTIKIFQVFYGDAILISYLGNDGKNHNIFVDSGFSETYNRTIKQATQQIIEKKENIDIFIITHNDQDHIGGILEFIKDYGDQDIVKNYWFNGGDIKISTEKSNTITYTEGEDLKDYLITHNKPLTSQIHNELAPFNVFGAELTILSPSYKNLQRFEKKLKAFQDKKLKEEERRLLLEKEREEHLTAGGEDDYNESIDDLAKRQITKDNRLEHEACISFLFEYGGISILFLADATPAAIKEGLEALSRKKGVTENEKLKVNYVKLSHHASKYNTDSSLLKKIECQKFIISANGINIYNLPHKETLSRILKHSERNVEQKIDFIFNYDTPQIKGIFSESDRIEHNFDCYYPKEDENGYVIRL